MHRFGRALLASCLLVIAFIVSAARAQNGGPETLLTPGEYFLFQARWGIFPKAGIIEVFSPAEDPTQPPCLRHVTVRIATDGTIGRLYRYEAVGETRFDPTTGWMVDSVYRTKSSRHRQHRELRFAPDHRTADYRDYEDPSRNETVRLPAEGRPMDLITSLVAARALDLTPGSTRDILVQVDKQFYPLRLRAGSTLQPLHTARGDFLALPITPEPKGPPQGLFKRGGSLRVWLDSAPDRLPLRVEVMGRFGTVTADLVRHNPGAVEKKNPTPAPRPALVAAELPPSSS